MKNSSRLIALLAGISAVTLGYFVAPQAWKNNPENKPQVAEAPPVAARPAEPAAAKVVQAPKPAPAEVMTASFDTVRVDAAGDAVIAGRAAPGASVAVKWNGAVVGQAVADAAGAFAIIPEKPLSAGSGALTLEATKDGKTVVSESSIAVSVQPQQPVVVAKLDPAKPTQVEQAGETQVPKGTVLMGAVDYDDQGNIMFSGKAPAGATIRFYVDNALAGETIADAAGNWSFTGAAALAVGPHTLRADAIDAKGAVVSRAETPFLREAPAKIVAMSNPVQPQAASNTEQAVTPESTVAAATPPNPPVLEIRRIVIQPGNNLWRMSRKIYGKGQMYTVIFEANRDQIKDPNRVYPGQILAAPDQKG